MLRRLLIPLALLASLLLVPAAHAADLAPADGATFEATITEGVPFTVVGAPRLAPVHVVVAQSPALVEADTVDFVGLSASLGEAGTYRGLSRIGDWAARPGTYFWQARAAGVPLGPVRRIVIAPASRALPLLTRSESRAAARSHLRREFRSYRRGTARRIRCARRDRMHVRCRVSWRFGDLRYAGRVDVAAASDEELVAQSRVHRRAGRL